MAVSTNQYWIPIDTNTPLYVKVQLLTKGGVAMHGVLQPNDSFYTHWTPLPKHSKN